MKFDMWEWSRWKHPRTAQFLQHLVSIGFAPRYEALCKAHLRLSKKPPVAVREEAFRNIGRPMYYSKLSHRYLWREAWRVPSGLPKYASIGLDVRITERVELELVFATPDGHLSAPFTRYLKQIRQMEKPDYKHANPAPRIGSFEELPIILAESLTLYDDIARSLKADSWWELSPKPWAQEKPAEVPYQEAA